LLCVTASYLRGNAQVEDGEHVHPESRTAEPATAPAARAEPDAAAAPEPTGAPEAHVAPEAATVGGVPAPRGGAVPPGEPAGPGGSARSEESGGFVRSPFRLPNADEPAPPVLRMVVMSAWAALLTLVGVAVGARAFVGMMFTPRVPSWFQPAVIGAGIVGIAFTAAAFASVQHRRLPWLLLPAATAALGAALAMTVSALAGP
jgi:hypothetical protein